MTSTASSFGKGATCAQANDVLAGSALAGKKPKGGRAGRASKPPRRQGASARLSKQGAGGKGASHLVRHDFAVSLRQLIPLLLVALAAFAVAMPVSTAAIPDVSVFNVDYTHDQLKFRFWLDELTLAVVLGSALFGLALGVRAFRFLLVKHEVTAVLSLPLPRASLFATRLGACLACIVVGIGVPLAASLVVNIAALNVWSGLFEQFAYVLCGLVLTAAIACAVGIVACALAGTVAEAAAFGVAVLAAVTAAAWSVNAMMDYLLVGNAAGEYLSSGTLEVAPSLLEGLSAANPLLFFWQEAAEHQTFQVMHPVYYPEAGTWVLVAAWLVVTALVCVLGLVMVKRRKGEKAGIAGLSTVLSAVVGIVVGLAAFGATFTLLASLNVPAAIVAAFAVFWLVSLVLFRGPLRGRTPLGRTLAVMGGETVVLAAVLVCLATGGLGYAGAVPSADRISSVSVSYPGSPLYTAARFDAASAGDGSYYVSAQYMLDDADAIEVVRGVHEQLVSTGSQPLASGEDGFGSTVVPYDVVIRYTLNDGSEVVRYYDRATYDELAALLQLDGTQEVRELARAAVSGDTSFLTEDQSSALAQSSARQAYALGDIYLSDRLYANPQLLNCDASARASLLAALAEDVANQSVDDRYHPASACRGVLMFTQSGESDAESFAYGIGNSVVYLTDEFENTLAWLEENGLSGYLAVSGAAGVADASVEAAAQAQLVESMTFQRFDPYESMNDPSEPRSAYFLGYRATVDTQFIAMQDFGTKFTTEDAAQIAELLPLARNAYFMDGGGYLVSCKLAGVDVWTYLFIPAEDAPEWLVRVAG